jgi:SMI1/KNR4 family protein SUKH-1
MISRAFLAWFKAATEAKWHDSSINPVIYGYQFVPGTRWNSGLSDAELREYERALGTRFPNDFRAFLRAMNGTDLDTVNIYGSSGEPMRRSVGVYSYPRDIEIVRRSIGHIAPHRDEICEDLASQGYDLPPGARLVPIYGHRFVVCGPDPESSVVLSIVVDGVDVIVYGRSLQDYLRREFLDEGGLS